MVRLLPDEINGAQIVKAEIPVVFRKGGNEVQKLVRQENPDIVLLVGQAGGRSSMNVERVAINCEDCPSGFPDNELPSGEKVYEDGPDGYFSNLPIKAMVKNMMDHGVPAAVSNTAGTYGVQRFDVPSALSDSSRISKYSRRIYPCSVRYCSKPSGSGFNDYRRDEQGSETFHPGCAGK